MLEEDLKDKKCPICGEPHLIKMCDNDHLCTCTTLETEGLHICPTCGEFTCPCGSHDVLVISRVTGYLQDVKGFNAAKMQELKDRKRYDV